MSLRMTLRECTAEDHAALELTSIMQAVSSGAPTRVQFADYLQRQWALHVALEAALEPWVPQPWVEQRLIKRHWLASDLRELGVCPQASIPAVPLIASHAEALGTLYVLEGSTLGLRIIEKHFAAAGASPGCTSRFIQGYGPDSGARWKAFLDCLEQLPATQWPAAIAAARATFALFLAQIADGPRTPGERCWLVGGQQAAANCNAPAGSVE